MSEKDTKDSSIRILKALAAESSARLSQPIYIATSTDGLAVQFSCGEEEALLQFQLRGIHDVVSREKGQLEPTLESWYYRKYSWLQSIIGKWQEQEQVVVTLLPTSLVQAGIDAGIPKEKIVDFNTIVDHWATATDFISKINTTKKIFSEVAKNLFTEQDDYEIGELAGTYRLLPRTTAAVESVRKDNETYHRAFPKITKLHEQLLADLAILE